jgi:hypothetical protein
MMAGNVVVDVEDGTLKLEGDADPNKVLITAGAEAGEYVITGVDGTMLDSGIDPITVSGVRNIHVDLGNGDDLAALVGANVRGRVAIQTGEGADRVVIGTGEGATEITGMLPADLSVNIRGWLRIATGAGEDDVAVDDAVLARLHVATGDDGDDVALGSTAALGDADARLDVTGGVHVHLGDGSDELQLDQVRSRWGILVTGGAGDDTIDANVVRGAALLVATDGGLDDVTVVDAEVHVLGIHTGDDNDSAEVRDSVFAVIGVSLGDGNDSLTTANLEARFARFAGGDGEDTLDNTVASTFERERITGFEIPPDANTPEPARRRHIGRFLRGLLP